MARGLWLCAVVVVLAVASTSEALRCFRCNNCDDDEAGTPYDCNDGYDVCLKINLAGRIQKSCSQKVACGLGAVERGVVGAWNDLKNLVKGVDEDAIEIPKDTKAEAFSCCETDLCNGVSSTVANLSLLVLLSMAAFLLQHC